MVIDQGFTTPREEQFSQLVPPKKDIPNEIMELAKKASTATISGMLFRKGFRFVYMAGVLPLKEGTVMAGRAYTLRYLPRREDHSQMGPDRPKYAQHIAIETVGPGDVLVVDGRGNTDAGIFGDILIARMRFRGAAGLVTDGALRDTTYLRTQDFPCFVRGVHGYAHSPQHWATDVQLPIACGNVTVYPGDLIVGDDDGVVMCPQAVAEEIIREAVDEEQHEVFVRELVDKGASVNEVHPLSPEMEAQYGEWRKTHPL